MGHDDICHKAMEVYGPGKVHAIIIRLQSAYDAYYKDGEVKRAADRAERGRA